MTSTILVSGATGFIGQALTRTLSAAGLHVRRLVRLGNCQTADDIGHDLSGADPLRIAPDTAAIVHLAQSRAYRGFPEDAPEMFRVNVSGAQSLLQAAAEANVSKFCLVSSGTVYEPFTGSMIETDALRPPSYLGASKAAAEMIAAPYARLMSLSVLRLFSPYGPGQTGRLIPNLINRVRNGHPITIAGDGGGMLFSPTYVDDVCEVIGAALADKWEGTFNVAAPFSLSIQEAAVIIGEHLQRSPRFERTTEVPVNLVPDLTALSHRYDVKSFTAFGSGILPVLKETG